MEFVLQWVRKLNEKMDIALRKDTKSQYVQYEITEEERQWLISNMKYKNPLKKIMIQKKLRQRELSAIDIQRVFRGQYCRRMLLIKKLEEGPQSPYGLLRDMYQKYKENVKSYVYVKIESKEWLLGIIR